MPRCPDSAAGMIVAGERERGTAEREGKYDSGI
jgi:hypothetical protein